MPRWASGYSRGGGVFLAAPWSSFNSDFWDSVALENMGSCLTRKAVSYRLGGAHPAFGHPGQEGCRPDPSSCHTEHILTFEPQPYL